MIGGVDGYKWNITDSYDNNLNQRNNVNNKDELGQKGAVDKSKTTECQTCKNRKYVDGSNEANVSFKNAAHISPEAASSAVRAHEGAACFQCVSQSCHAKRRSGICIRQSPDIGLPGMWPFLYFRWCDGHTDQIL